MLLHYVTSPDGAAFDRHSRELRRLQGVGRKDEIGAAIGDKLKAFLQKPPGGQASLNVIPANAGIQVFGENTEDMRVLESKPPLEMNHLPT